MRKIISVVGDAWIEENSDKYRMAFETGKALVDAGYRVASGGLGGVMQAAFRGAHASEKYREGDTIAILPQFDERLANECADIVIATGLDLFRNVIVGNSEAIIVVGGGAGTLCEVSSAWAQLRMIISFKNVEGTSKKVADTCIDHRKRYPFDDRCYGVESAEEAIALLAERLPLYTRRYEGIKAVERNG